ncbi:hypothetical protein IJ531_02825 [bacterium]|nr:hypothetical protein [bacterium]
MSNDISSEFNYVKMRTGHASHKTNNTLKHEDNNVHSNKSYEAAQDYYNALGRTKVNMDKHGIDNRVISSLDILKKDPEYVQSHIDFCDALQDKGYSLEDAIVGTDIIFERLRDEATYRS